jgi:hypothetical protein
MKRLHVHVSVDDLADSVRFYRPCSTHSRPFESPIMRSGCWTIRA